MSRILVGTSQLVGKLEVYATRFDVLEVRPVDTALPKLSKVAKWRDKVPSSFAFSVVLPKAVASFEDDGQALETAIETARVLQASAILLATPPSFRPTKRNRDRIAELAGKLPGEAHPLVWAASGMWEADDVMATASRAGWSPVFDAAQAPLPPGPMVYTRIRSLGHASRLGADRINHIARQLAGRREAIAIVEGDQAKKLRNELKSAVERLDVSGPAPAIFKPQTFTADDEEQ